MTINLAIQIAYFLLRAVSGVMFLQHGGQKLLGWFGGVPAEMGGPPALMSQMGIGGLLELVGGAAIALGLFTRPVAFVVSGEMAVAYWQFHAPDGDWPIQNHGELAVLYCFLFLFMAAYGGGELSLDGQIKKRRAKAAAEPKSRA